MALLVVVAAVLSVLVGRSGAAEWQGEVEFKQTNVQDFRWSVQMTIRNPDIRPALGFVVLVRLAHPASNAIELQPETNLHIDSSRSQHGLWSFRPTVDFGLSGNGAATDDFSFKVLFDSGPLYGKCTPLEVLVGSVRLLSQECTKDSCPSVCGDALCSGDESCTTCAFDCFGSSGCTDSKCGDKICSGSESASSCPSDCMAVSCTKPFRLAGLSLTTLLMVAGILLSIVFGVGSALYYKKWNQKSKDKNDDEAAAVNAAKPDAVLKRNLNFSQYESDESDDADEDDEFSRPDNGVDLSVNESGLRSTSSSEHTVQLGSTFGERPWRRNVTASPSMSAESTPSLSPSPLARSRRHPNANHSRNGSGGPRHSPQYSINSDFSVQRAPRVPGYLQDIMSSPYTPQSTGKLALSLDRDSWNYDRRDLRKRFFPSSSRNARSNSGRMSSNDAAVSLQSHTITSGGVSSSRSASARRSYGHPQVAAMSSRQFASVRSYANADNGVGSRRAVLQPDPYLTRPINESMRLAPSHPARR